MITRISHGGKQLLQRLEGWRSFVYADSAGKPTIGYGHLVSRAELGLPPVARETPATLAAWMAAARARYPVGITLMEGEILLDRDLAPAEGALRKWVVVPLTQNQFDALVCFIYNVGVGAFRESTLLHQLNSGKYDEVPAQLRRWNKEWDTKKRQFVVNKGLAIRREQEVVRWLER